MGGLRKAGEEVRTHLGLERGVELGKRTAEHFRWREQPVQRPEESGSAVSEAGERQDLEDRQSQAGRLWFPVSIHIFPHCFLFFQVWVLLVCDSPPGQGWGVGTPAHEAPCNRRTCGLGRARAPRVLLLACH